MARAKCPLCGTVYRGQLLAEVLYKLRWHLRNIHHLGEDEIDGIIRKLMGR